MIPPEKVKQIQELRKQGLAYSVIAEDCSVSVSTVVKYCKQVKPDISSLQATASEPNKPPWTPGSGNNVDSPPVDIKCLDIEQSTRENAQWAMDSAGHTKRTGQRPTECPNNVAYFMYLQALEKGPEFLSRFIQIESKSSESTTFQRACQLSIQEIEEMLDEIKYLDSLPSFLK